MTKTAWYSDCYRRNLVDMHIDDWDERFLSEFDPQTYADNLKRAHIAAPMLYLQSHVGHCYFPTKAGHMHGALRGREDLMRQLVLLCQEAGMHVVGYYSLIYNTYEEDRHPEWRIRDAHGVSARQRGGRYGLCCPNNPEYFAFVMEQIAEMAAYFPTLDGMFYDMTFWPDVCHCPHCVEKYRAATGRDTLPAVDWNDPVWREFSDLRIRWMADFARAVTARTKSLWDGISVEHNYANAVASDTTMTASTEQINEQCDYTGGDLYGDLYNHSFTAKYFYGVTKHQPFEYMTCRCDRTLYAHTNSKAEETLAVEVMLTAAHHGASFIIDAIDPVGTLDARVYDRIGRVFARQMPYEAYFRGTMVSDAGVLYATTGRYNTTGQPFDSKKCSVSAVRTLIEAHIPVSVVSVAATADAQTQALPYLLAPQIAGLTDENRADLCRYVENGGTLYFSG
ncbi:MAG: alpha-L-fucosidase, partial [Clostridia bacterium]|nr:alpha-L-fucosidase [Clostridia bacterium]